MTIENHSKPSQKNRLDEIIPPDVFERRSGTDRRKASACGFAYISTVGWICRREQNRRMEDHEEFIDLDPYPKPN